MVIKPTWFVVESMSSYKSKPLYFSLRVLVSYSILDGVTFDQLNLMISNLNSSFSSNLILVDGRFLHYINPTQLVHPQWDNYEQQANMVTNP